MIDTTAPRLSPLLRTLGIPQSELRRRTGLSTSAISRVCAHGEWPTFNAALVREAIEACIQERKPDAAMQQALQAALNYQAPQARSHHAKCSLPLESTNPNEPKEEPMLLQNEALSQETRQHFNLPRNPFVDDVQSVDDVFQTPSVRYVRAALMDCALNHGFLAVVGESGAGKSTLREDLADRLLRDGRQIVLIEPYVLAMEDNDIKGKTLKSVHIAEAILEAVAPGSSPKRSPEARFRQIHRALQESAKAGNKHVLVIEEAHALPIPTLKHLKRFFELKQGFERLLGIVLIGQTELAVKLSENNPAVREVVQRCEVVTLQPLTDGKLAGYLKHKFARAGKEMAEVLEESAIDAVAERLSQRARTRQGTVETSLLYPLAVNNLISAAMNQTAELGFDKVDGDAVRGV